MITPDHAADREHAGDLHQHLVAHRHFLGIADAAEGGRGEHAGQHRADDAADSVHREHVERVVHLERLLHVAGGEEAHDAGGGADCERADRPDESRGRRDRAEPRDHAGHDAEHRGLAVAHPFADHPGERSGRRADVRHQHRHARRAVGGERAARVEAEPAHPQHAGAGHRHGHVVRRHRRLGKAPAPAEHQRADQRRHARVQVHDRAAGEVHDAPSSPSQPSPHTQCATGQ